MVVLFEQGWLSVKNENTKLTEWALRLRVSAPQRWIFLGKTVSFRRRAPVNICGRRTR